MKITKLYSKKEYLQDVKKACYELSENGLKNQGRVIFYFQTCLKYKLATKKLMSYPN